MYAENAWIFELGKRMVDIIKECHMNMSHAAHVEYSKQEERINNGSKLVRYTVIGAGSLCRQIGQ